MQRKETLRSMAADVAVQRTPKTLATQEIQKLVAHKRPFHQREVLRSD